MSIEDMYILIESFFYNSNTDVDTLRLDFRVEQVSSIEHLTLLYIPIDLEQLYSIAPALRTLHTKVKVCHPAHNFHPNSPESLKRLSLQIYHLYFSTIEQLLRPMTRLAHLIIIASNVYYDMCDGAAWERILSKIISFKFLFYFHKSTWTEEPIKLDSFRSLFWLEKKQWYVGYDRCTVSRFSLLYSIPYFMNIYPWHIMKGTIDTKSTRPGPQVLLLNNINHFTVNEQLPTDYKCLNRLINLQNLVISESDKVFHILFHNVVPHIDISRITTLFIVESRSKTDINSFVRFVSSMPHLRSLTPSIILLKLLFFSHWPNIRRLEIFASTLVATTTEISLTLNEIDAFYRSFSHIENLTFRHDVDLNLSKLLNKIPTSISNVVVLHPRNVTLAEFPDFITRDWVEQNTCLRNFIYSCNQINVVSLWF